MGSDLAKDLKRAKKGEPKKSIAAKKVTLDDELKEKLNTHLKSLNKMDRTLEASLITRWKANQVLAAAISTRAPENLLSTIASTLWSINSDATHALGGGRIKVIILNAENITTMVAPIDKHTIIISVSNPKSNVGLISMYLETIAKKIAPLLEKFL
jgi:predicted regulator of Ras-like GTPase activity (Roadblock/LC7/MglB family)